MELAFSIALIILPLSPDVEIEIKISFFWPRASTCLENISLKLLSLPIAVIVGIFEASEINGKAFLF